MVIFLVRVSLDVKRHHDYGNSYKGKTFNLSGSLTVQRFNPLTPIMVRSKATYRWT